MDSEARGDFCGKVAIVTGGASGIGREVVKKFAAKGAHVLVGDMRPPEVNGDPNVIYVDVDITSPDAAVALIETATQQFGQLDVLVNNVGAFPARDGFLTTSTADWRRAFDVNFFSMVECCRAAIPVMIDSGASTRGKRTDAISISSHATTA